MGEFGQACGFYDVSDGHYTVFEETGGYGE
jgi:hypothetical protein